MEARRPRSSHKVSMTWHEDESTVTRMMQFADECIETKTVTTTTTTKRSYPPLFLREPRDIHSLDSKEYPLAGKPTPHALRKLTFDLDDYEPEGWDDEDDTDAQVSPRCACPVDLTRVLTRVPRGHTAISEHRVYRQH
jgi:F-box and WD-40 domain protein CDC4